MKKVSIISPCYNGADYVTKFFDSLLIQDYQNVEFIFVNDGSTDNTEEIFNIYKPQFEAKGWDVIYIYQENSGQAAALSNGLKVFSGEYLMWPDSDDILYPEHISKKVALMEQNPEAGMGFFCLDQINEEEPDVVVKKIKRKLDGDNDPLMDDLLLNRNMIWPPIAGIVRSSAFLDVNPERDIYSGKAGQNFQMYFPLSVKYKACYSDESCGVYLIRGNSHSRSQKDYEKRQFDHQDTWVHTIMRSPLSDEEKTQAIITSVKHYEYLKNKFNNKSNSREQTKNKDCNRIKVKLFGFIPLFKISNKKDKRIVKLFNFIPFLTLE